MKVNGIKFFFVISVFIGSFNTCNEGNQLASNLKAEDSADTVTMNVTPVEAEMSVSVIPKIKWQDRELYEKEGYIVFFTDCGFYKGNTEEFTGTTCDFYNEQWVLREPKLEPTDNFLVNGDFSEIDEDQVPSWNIRRYNESSIKVIKNSSQYISKPFALQLEIDATPNGLAIVEQIIPVTEDLAIKGKYVTLQIYYNNLDEKSIGVNLMQKIGDIWDHSFQLLPQTDSFQRYIISKKIDMDSVRFGVDIEAGGVKVMGVFDDAILVRGYFPMGFK